MKVLVSAKTVVGLLSSAAITGSLYAGLDFATSSLPAHWHIDGIRESQPVEVQLVSEQQGGFSCEWLGLNPKDRIAKCPQVMVTARRAEANWPTGVAATRERNVIAVLRAKPEEHMASKQ